MDLARSETPRWEKSLTEVELPRPPAPIAVPSLTPSIGAAPNAAPATAPARLKAVAFPSSSSERSPCRCWEHQNGFLVGFSLKGAERRKSGSNSAASFHVVGWGVFQAASSEQSLASPLT